MADRFKKDSTPPPLLLMPAGGGLTLTPPDQPNVLMPVVQQSATPALLGLDPELEAEADSFVGQSMPPPGGSSIANNSQPSSYFQSSSVGGHDPFAQVGPGHPPPVSTVSPLMAAPLPAAPPASVPLQPPAAASSVPLHQPPAASLPPSASVTTGSTNIYRQNGGRPQYVPPPSGSFSPSMGAPPTAMVPPMTAPPSGMFPPPSSSSQPPPTATIPPMTVAPASPAGQDNMEFTGGLYYTPVRHHWCFRQDQEGSEVWRPFSVIDSTQLELAFSTKLQENPSNTVILTNGGRYDVNIGNRVRTPVYWNEAPTPVKRCSWFYKREGDNRYIPYEEDFCEKLEHEYKKAMETGGWHRRLDFPGNVVIVMHNANVIVQFPASAAPDEWGNIQGDQMRPRVVKRGVDDFATIVYGERSEVDHLIFFVPGIEDMSQNSKSVEVLVDEFRTNALSLMQSHFTQAFNAKTVNRVEFLPIVWSKALLDGASEIKSQMGSVTLPSTSKLRHFINNTLLDTLFYTSPVFCQNICDTVGKEMNRMFHIFLERNQSFSGDVSVAGHSLGSVILFDILSNQNQFGNPAPSLPDQTQPEPPSQPELNGNGVSPSQEKVDQELSLEAMLARVGLEDKISLFEQEQIDLESLIMCSEQDLKDIGLPMGPRKKLVGVMKEELEKKEAKKKADVLKQQEQEAKEKDERLLSQATRNMNNSNEKAQVSGQFSQGEYGAGQLQVHYPQLDFTPSALFALGSPIAVFLSLRGVQTIGELFQLPTCPRVFNIFHPYDPMAYRLEPMIRANTATVRPVQVAHYKGRKRLHLEFKEAVTKYGTDIKQKIVDSFKSTWNSLNEFAKAHTSGAKTSTMETEMQSEMKEMMMHIQQQQMEDDRASMSSMAEEEIHMGALNEGHRVDFVLQEGPLESFNDYLSALASHSCYWESEDTALFLLKEIFTPIGVQPQMPGMDKGRASRESSLPPRSGPPPPSMPSSSGVATPTGQFGLPGAVATPPTYRGPPPPSSGYPGGSPLYQAGPPPVMFSPSQPPAHSSPNPAWKSPYVAPPADFNNMPAGASPQGMAPTGPPPMGPAIVGGYRRQQPK